MSLKALPFNKEKIEEIKKDYPTPFYVYDEKGIKETVQKIKKAFSWNDGYKEYFAVKATPNPAVLKLLRELGCGIDCASTTELMLGERLGFSKDEIMFTSNDTPVSDYKKASDLGAIINLDDVSHLEFLDENGISPECVCMRYNPGSDFIVQNDIMGKLKESKFGMKKDHLIECVRTLSKKGTKTFGIHAMLASCALNEDYYPTLARELFLLALEVTEKTGVKISFINLSGGIGIPYRPEEKPVDIERIGEKVKKVYEEILLPKGYEIKLFTEMGRFVTGPHGYLISTVLHLKKTYKNYLGIDATACNLMRPAIYGAYHHITILSKENCENSKIYDVVGSLCENNDKFAVDRALPEAEIGDIIAIHDAGAHGYSMGYNYNGKLRCAELMLKENGETVLIRRAETPEDYFSTLDIYPEFKRG